MPVIDYLYRGTRDVVGGAFGGMVAAAAVSDVNQNAVTGMGVSLIVVLAGTYYIFDYLKDREQQAVQSQNGKPEQEGLEQHWDSGKAS